MSLVLANGDDDAIIINFRQNFIFTLPYIFEMAAVVVIDAPIDCIRYALQFQYLRCERRLCRSPFPAQSRRSSRQRVCCSRNLKHSTSAIREVFSTAGKERNLLARHQNSTRRVSMWLIVAFHTLSPFNLFHFSSADEQLITNDFERHSGLRYFAANVSEALSC